MCWAPSCRNRNAVRPSARGIILNVILKRFWNMKTRSMFAGFLLLGIFVAASFLQAAEHASAASGPNPSNVYPVKEGFIDVNGLFLYYTEIGQGPPLVILHGGPGGSHNYFLPYLLPLARTNRLIFMDERGSGRSGRLQDPSGYTVENMAADVSFGLIGR
jgi:alpha/beta hydrolase family protein